MDAKYVKESKVTQKTEMERDKELIRSLIRTKIDLQTATKNFEQAEDELIDYYTYQIKAHQSKLDYLVKKAKKRRVALNMIEAVEYRDAI